VRRLGATLVDHPWVFITIAGLVLFALWVTSTRTQEHEVRAAFDAAVNVVPGLDVQVDGVDAGKVKSVDLVEGRAIVTLGLEGDRFWPLHRGTTARISWGTTAGTGTRRIDLDPAPARSAPEIPEGGIIATGDTVTPVEFDQVFNTLNRPTRGGIQEIAANLDTTLEGRAGALNEGLRSGAPAVEAASDVLSDLGQDEAALSGLVEHGAGATRVMASRERRISNLISVADATFATFARNSDDLRATISATPATLSDARTTLERLDPTVERLDALVGDLRPAVRTLSPLAQQARPALRELRRTVALARDTVSIGRRAAPPTTALLTNAQPFVKTLGGVLQRLKPMLACVRPFAPEVAGFAHGFGSWTKNYVPKTGQGGRANPPVMSHYARVLALASPTSVHNYPPGELSSPLLRAAGKTYTFPRPPGFEAKQPMMLPECGITPAALDPSKDPEARLPSTLPAGGRGGP
jgi:phospholipid/cholesterol/gamma-HCH transport system substrate-binding protein